MKRVSQIFMLCVAVFLFSNCKKGDTGPAGPSGNANVITYTFGTQTFTGSLNLTLTNISQGRIDSSLVLCYYNPSTEVATAWYPSPGFGSAGAYQTRFFYYQTATSPSTYLLAIRSLTTAGAAYTSALTFTKIKVIIVPSSSILTGGRYAQPAVDLSNYNEVKAYYNLTD